MKEEEEEEDEEEEDKGKRRGGGGGVYGALSFFSLEQVLEYCICAEY